MTNEQFNELSKEIEEKYINNETYHVDWKCNISNIKIRRSKN